MKTPFVMNAAPVAFLEFLQWHTRIAAGWPLTSYWMERHKHDPVRVIGEAEEGRGPEAMICETMSFCATEKRELVPFSLSKC